MTVHESQYITDRFEISKRETSPEGYLVIRDSKLARVGVLQYRKFEISIIGAPAGLSPDHPIRVYRGPDQLFSAEVLDSFKSKPSTLKHPTELVSPKTFKTDTVGFSKDDVRAEGDYMVGTLVFNDAEAIREIELGTKELSLGYTARIIWSPGISPEGDVYDAVQTEIRGNHIALVSKGRCGSDCKISDEQTNNEVHMPETHQIILDGIGYDCPAQTAQAFKKIIADRDSQLSKVKDELEKAEEDLKDAEEEKAKSDKEKDELEAKLDQAEESKMKDADLDSLVEVRAKLIADAKSIVEGFDHLGKSNAEIKVAVVKDACPDLDVSAKSVDYINARFDAILEMGKKPSAIKDALGGFASSSVSSNVSLSERKRQERIENNKTKRG